MALKQEREVELKSVNNTYHLLTPPFTQHSTPKCPYNYYECYIWMLDFTYSASPSPHHMEWILIPPIYLLCRTCWRTYKHCLRRSWRNWHLIWARRCVVFRATTDDRVPTTQSSYFPRTVGYGIHSLVGQRSHGAHRCTWVSISFIWYLCSPLTMALCAERQGNLL